MTQLSDEIVERMVEAVRLLLETAPRTTQQDYIWWEMRAIVAVIRKPTDPDVLVIREILGASCSSRSGAKSYRSGEDDSSTAFQDALSAYKRIKAGDAA